MQSAEASASGLAAATAAYLLWGVLPAFWKLLGAVPPLEVLANRVLWSLFFKLALLAGLGRLGELRAVLRSPRERLGLGAASVFIALNWGIFIWAVQANRIVETSLRLLPESLAERCAGRRTDWMNNALYEIASFMVMRESVPWRWSHTRHHSDTIIVGRDPEIQAPRPPDILGLLVGFFGVRTIYTHVRHVLLHCTGRMTPEEKTYVPESEYPRVIIRARIYLLIYATVIGLAVHYQTILPLMYVGLPTLYGSWLQPIYGYTQHAGLAENVLDHRLNCRTVYMNRIHRFL